MVANSSKKVQIEMSKRATLEVFLPEQPMLAK